MRWERGIVAFIEVGDVRLFFTDEGTGDPPTLFIHGYSCDSHDWMWQLPFFTRSHRVIAVDLRGHGRSSAPEKGFDARDFADDLAGLLDALACGPVVAVGHSLGGLVASALAVEHPSLVQAVVSVDPGYLIPDESFPMIQGMVVGLDDDPVTTVQTMLGSSSYTPASPTHLKPWHMRRIAGVPPHVLRDTGTALFGGPEALAYYAVSSEYLRGRICPVLAIYAAPERAALEAPLLSDPRSQTLAWEGSGHWLHQERPDEFNSVVETWIALLGSPSHQRTE
jgi:pimeloyl-ACP methyl ester carboxylesterase